MPAHLNKTLFREKRTVERRCANARQGTNPKEKKGDDSTLAKKPVARRNLKKGKEKMAFLAPPATAAPTQPEKIDRARAERLFRALRDRKMIRRNYSMSNWSMYTARLRREMKDDVRLEQVLEWYCANCGRMYIPQVCAASSFYERFNELELAMEREQAKQGPIPSPAAEKVAAGMKDLKWPGGCVEQLPRAAQVAIDVYATAFDRIKIKSRGEGRDAKLARSILETKGLLLPERWAMVFIRNVFTSIVKWRAFDGDLIKYVRAKAPAAVEQHGRGVLQQYNSRPFDWDILTEG